MSRCDLCELHKSAQSVCIPCEGEASSGIVLVGEAPGAVEDEQNRPFVGDAGILQARVLKRVGLRRKELGITNACRCRPPGNRSPKASEIEACKVYLREDLQRLKPRVVVVMGNVALKSVLGLTGIMSVRGSVFVPTGIVEKKSQLADEFPGVCFIPTIHPAAALRRWEDEKTIEHDFALAKRVAESGYQKTEAIYHTCSSVKEIQRLLGRLTMSCEDYVSFDTETTGFDYWSDKILCFSFSNREGTGWVVPLYGHKCRAIWTEAEFAVIVGLVKGFLESEVPKSAQNGVFDILMVRGNFGIEVKNWVLDTMLLHHAVDENQLHGLDFISGWYTDVDPYKNEVKKSLPRGSKSYADAPEEVLWKYAAADADVTYRSSHELEREAIEDDVKEVHDRIMLPLARVMAEAEWRGIHVDRERLDALHEEYTEQANGLLQKVYEAAGREFNVGSYKQVGEVLFDKLGLPVVKTTEGGNRSVDKDVLAQLAKLHPVPRHLVELSSVEHDIKTYLKGLDGATGLLKYIHSDGRVHPRWMLHRAVTGRLSSVDPNVQAIKKEKRGPFRHLFMATPGWYWLHFDYSQMEANIAGYVAQDEKMIELHRTGGDVHRLVASQMFECTEEEVTEDQRDQAKGVVFGLNYGRQEYSLAQEFGISIEKARKYIEGYFILFEGVRKHFDTVKHLVDTVHEIQTPFKRKRHLYGVPNLKQAIDKGFFSSKALKDAKRALAEMYRMAINVTIQSPANDVLGLACIRAHERFMKGGMQTRLLISQHDAWLGEAPEEELEDAASIVKEELERPVPEFGGAVFGAEVEIGRFWGDNSVKIKGIT